MSWSDTARVINAAGLEIIKRNEGCRLTAYRDVVGVLTIGYGYTGPDVREGMTISQGQADQMLNDRIAREFVPGVLGAIGGAPTTDNQLSAMVSLAYNIGVGAFYGSTVARMHKAGDHTSAAAAFALWDKAGGNTLSGLVRRRSEEAALYLKPDALSGAVVVAAPPSEANTPAPVSGASDNITAIIHALQTQLKTAGFYKGVVDDDPGPQTLAAITAWRNAS